MVSCDHWTRPVTATESRQRTECLTMLPLCGFRQRAVSTDLVPSTIYREIEFALYKHVTMARYQNCRSTVENIVGAPP
jgi:hypothetical protein